MHCPLPAGRGAPVRALAGATALIMAASATYTVQPGDSLSEIAQAQRIPTDVLATANGVTNPDHILAGQQLVLSVSDDHEVAPADDGTSTVHEVRPGEHLTGIARRYQVSVADLVDANDLSDADHVVASRTLQIPSAGPPTASTSPAPTSQAPPASVPRAAVGDIIERTAREHGWSPAFVKAIAWQESGWRNDRISSADAVGIMQVLPSTGAFVSQHLAGRTLDLADPHDNVLAGVLFLDYLHGLTGGDVERTLAGYYQGLASLDRNGMFDDTRAYIDSVLALRERFR